VWIEDANHYRYRIAGNSDYVSCDGDDYTHFYFEDQTYYVVGKVAGSSGEEKVRGPFNADSICGITGDVGDWSF
ncbi:26854_t:CDS:1, partial [Dentiscutata erythropus]